MAGRKQVTEHAEHQARPQVGDENWKPGEDPV